MAPLLPLDANAKGIPWSEDQGPWYDEPASEAVRLPTEEEASHLASVMKPLAGKTLAPPKFHPVSWRQGQVFLASEDPDRMAEPWSAPPFIKTKDPKQQRSKTSVEELPVPTKMASGSFARVVRGVLDEQDCADVIAAANEKGFTPALVNIGRGAQKLDAGYRDGHRVMADSPEFVAWLFKVVEPHLPAEMYGGQLVDLNERCRFLCYTPGQEFSAHFDGQFRRSDGASSRVTLQLYLHDVDSKNGGATTFHLDERSGKGDVPHQPRAGDVLLFTQNLLHSGSLLTGGLKYTMRTEAMYSRSFA